MDKKKKKKHELNVSMKQLFFRFLSNFASDSITIKTENRGQCPYRIMNKECVSLLTTYKGIACVVGYSRKYSN